MKIEKIKNLPYSTLNKIYNIIINLLAFVIVLLGILLVRFEEHNAILNNALIIVLHFSIAFMVIGAVLKMKKKSENNNESHMQEVSGGIKPIYHVMGVILFGALWFFISKITNNKLIRRK